MILINTSFILGFSFKLVIKTMSPPKDFIDEGKQYKYPQTVIPVFDSSPTGSTRYSFVAMP
jgi:hypothetical protein